MQEFITEIIGMDVEAFTPAAVLCIMVLCLGLECISSVAYSVLVSSGLKGR